MLMFCATEQGAEEWAKLPEEVLSDSYAKIGAWFGQNSDKLVITHQLQPPSTATTVRFKDGQAVVSDGPFMEAKEVIGGFAVFDVADLDAALELARTWPAQGTVEVRPVVER
jgi:hypothetical protein